MRILIYSLNFAPELTGTGKYSGEMARWLANKGHEIRVVTAPPYYPQWQIQNGYKGFSYSKELLAGKNSRMMKVWRCPLWVPQNPGGVKRLLHLASFSATSAPVALAHAGWKPDLIFAVEPTLMAAPWALLTAKISGAKSWLHIQDFEVDAAFNLGLLRLERVKKLGFAAERRLMQGFDRVSSISENMLERLKEKGVKPGKSVFFPNWVDTRGIYPLKRKSMFQDQLRIAEDAVVALYAGNMGEKQGLELLVEAASQLQDDPGIQFVFAGSGNARPRIEKMTENLPNVSWLPLQPEDRLNELLNLADIHLLPQRADAADLVMPSKLTGMLASGKAIVACADPYTQIGKVVGGCGIVVPPGNGDALANAIKTMAGDRYRRQNLGAKSRAYAERFLDYDVIMANIHEEMLRI
ncbi:MAG: glycosyltransferase WbuB [Desulfobacteraceae bacterium]|nr:glycosyltransferase WbuB [Desulfobacteraceae bacterium]